MRQQAKLEFAGKGEFALQTLLLAGDLLVEASIFDGDGELRGERGQGALVVLGEIITASVLEIEHADYVSLIDERNGEFGVRVGIALDVDLAF